MNTYIVAMACVALVLPARVGARQGALPWDCAEVKTMVAVTKAKSASVLLELRKKLSNSYRARLVFAARWFELRTRDPRAASALLELIPQNTEQHLAFFTFSGPLCQNEPVSEIYPVADLGDRLPRDMAMAVVLVPSKMKAYVEFALETTDVPYSDYVKQMERPCRARHAEFAKTVNALPPKSLEFFRRQVFKVDGCVPLALPEAK